MKDAHLIRNCVLLSLPTAALMFLGAYFLAFVVPVIQKNEREAVKSASRDVAEQLKEGAVAPDFRWKYEAGVEEGGEWAAIFPASMTWKAWGAKGQMGRYGWGWRDIEGGRVVWVRTDGVTALGKLTDIGETDYALWLWTACPLLMAALLAATVFAVRRMHAYAKVRDDFLAAAAHDLATPLSVMRYMICHDHDEAFSLCDKMVRLVGNITDFVSLGGRVREPSAEPFCIGDAFDEAYCVFEKDYADEPSGPVKILGDRDLTVLADMGLATQILWNLLGNELKYAAPFGEVSVEFRAEKGFVCIEFADEGEGMSEEEMAHAFDRYWRSKSESTVGKGGFGLGLCTSRENARRMGGDITVGRNGDRGCVFTLRLPAEGRTDT